MVVQILVVVEEGVTGVQLTLPLLEKVVLV